MSDMLNMQTDQGSQGVINSQQSTITFVGAPTIITVVSQVLQSAGVAVASNKLALILFSLVLGMLIYWASSPVVGKLKDKLIGAVFALLNSFAIAATVLGLEANL